VDLGMSALELYFFGIRCSSLYSLDSSINLVFVDYHLRSIFYFDFVIFLHDSTIWMDLPELSLRSRSSFEDRLHRRKTCFSHRTLINSLRSVISHRRVSLSPEPLENAPSFASTMEAAVSRQGEVRNGASTPICSAPSFCSSPEATENWSSPESDRVRLSSQSVEKSDLVMLRRSSGGPSSSFALGLKTEEGKSLF